MSTEPTGDVFAELVGQQPVVAELRAAVAAAGEALQGLPGRRMTHAWLFCGPPGSGRSVAARAFAAALQCPDAGCGRCAVCHAVRCGAHPDVDVVVPEGLHLRIDRVRAIVAHAARAPSHGRWQIALIEDADRIEERTANTLLRVVEEPPDRGVFLLCAPSPEDLLPTVRSRCRVVGLRVPPVAAITDVLVRRDGVDEALAAFAARACGGHVGRARRLATDEQARRRRRDVLALPTAVDTVPGAFVAAANLVEAAEEEAVRLTAEPAQAETAALAAALGAQPGRPRPRGTAGAFAELADEQRSRATRAKRDALDRALDDLAGFYRDVLMVQLGDGAPVVVLTNADLVPEVTRVAAGSRPETTLRRIDAVLACRNAIAANVAPLLAVERLALTLQAG